MHHLKRHSFLIIAILVILAGYLFLRSQNAVAPNGSGILSDQELIDYARSDFDKEEMAFKELVLGKHNDVDVLVSFPCSDLCPENTTRIIRYDIDSKLTNVCEIAGGEVKSILVPIAITVLPEAFCFPKVLIDAGVYEFVEEE